MIRNRWSLSSFIFSAALGFVALLTLSSAASGVNGFDETIQFVGLTSTLEHAQKVLALKNPDFASIHSNLEFYGIASRMPGYLIWTALRIAKKIVDPFGDLGLSTYNGTGLGDAYRSGYFAISHLISVGYLVGTSIIVNRVTRRLGAPHPELAGVMTLLYPALIGFSLISIKDTAFAFFYSLYSYATASTWWQRCERMVTGGKQGQENRQICLHAGVAGLLVSIYTSSLLVVLATETIMAATFLGKTRLPIRLFTRKLFIFIALTGATWFILSPQGWNRPLPFLLQSIHYSLDGSQAWGGCMNFLNTCPRKGEDWNAVTYLKEWLFSTMPLLHLFGLILAIMLIAIFIKDLIYSWKTEKYRLDIMATNAIASPFLLSFLLQASIIPSVLFARNGFIYDSIRHVLFLLPPLTIFSYLGLAQTFTRCNGRKPRIALTLITGIMACLVLVNLVLLHPYQYTYFNELALARGINWTNTDIDFYYASDAESLRNFMKTDEFKQFASEGGLDVKGSPSMEGAYIWNHFPRKEGHAYFFTNHTRQPGVRLKQDCEQIGKDVFRTQFLGPVNIYGTPQVCLASSYRDWDPF